MATEPLDLTNAREVRPLTALLIMVLGAILLVALGLTVAKVAKALLPAPSARAVSVEEETAVYMLRLGADRWMRACAYQAGIDGMSVEAMERSCGVDFHLEPIKLQSPVDQ